MNADDFIGAYVRWSLADYSEMAGVVSSVVREGRSLSRDPFEAMLEGSTFLVISEETRTVIEVEGRDFTQYHLIK